MQATGIDPWLLDTQYRMHPAIANFPNDLFYNGELKSGVKAAERPAPTGNNNERCSTQQLTTPDHIKLKLYELLLALESLIRCQPSPSSMVMNLVHFVLIIVNPLLK